MQLLMILIVQLGNNFLTVLTLLQNKVNVTHFIFNTIIYKSLSITEDNKVQDYTKN